MAGREAPVSEAGTGFCDAVHEAVRFRSLEVDVVSLIRSIFAWALPAIDFRVASVAGRVVREGFDVVMVGAKARCGCRKG